ncbi:MAG: N-acetylglucosamine-6-phosphate deacetylase [Armatimonadetes bacterium]|nr:N-acetylglucosamine-6-phosphate deacetylase [Armatimonadota bacterium]
MPSHVTAIVNGLLVLPDHTLPNGLLLLEDGRISFVGSREERAVPAGATVWDATGHAVLPGLIDTHVHGSHGDDVMLHGAEGIRRISARFPQFGTTAWLPSTISARHPELTQAVRDCVAAQRIPADGAEIVGIHVEGPYINPTRKGAQPAEGIRDPDAAEVEELLQAGEGQIRIMTLAPEISGGMELIELLVQRGIVASLGHSDATWEQAVEAIQRGATHATHLFNAMPPIHHRAPGLITACLNSPEVIAEIIPDGVHLHPEIVRMAIGTKQTRSIALITDAFSATGLPDGIHTLGPHRVQVNGALCTLEDGTIAGSILTMDRAVRNTRRFCDMALFRAVQMASLVPAQVAGCAHRKGSLAVGKDADVVLMDPDDRVCATWVRGRLAWSGKC